MKIKLHRFLAWFGMVECWWDDPDEICKICGRSAGD